MGKPAISANGKYAVQHSMYSDQWVIYDPSIDWSESLNPVIGIIADTGQSAEQVLAAWEAEQNDGA